MNFRAAFGCRCGGGKGGADGGVVGGGLETEAEVGFSAAVPCDDGAEGLVVEGDEVVDLELDVVRGEALCALTDGPCAGKEDAGDAALLGALLCLGDGGDDTFCEGFLVDVAVCGLEMDGEGVGARGGWGAVDELGGEVEGGDCLEVGAVVGGGDGGEGVEDVDEDAVGADGGDLDVFLAGGGAGNALLVRTLPPLEEMGVVDVAGVDLAGVPGEGGIAGGAPHLVAA